MIKYKTFTLDNGLRLIVHKDKNVQIAISNILYDVGSRDELPHKTGFAHLFEHLMFGGSKHIDNFDEPLEQVGGSSNAFTSHDITNYYNILPAQNIETSFWLESDRMFQLSFKEDVLEVQRKVVIEEFKQNYLNQPYGDIWLRLLPLCYKIHPYRWDTIGKDISHIEKITLEDVKTFFYQHYCPDNAILVVSGNVDSDKIYALTQKWFGNIPPSKTPYLRNLPVEPTQTAKQACEIRQRVPSDLIIKGYHTCNRLSKNYHPTLLLSDILGRGNTSLLYKNLIEDKKLFTLIETFTTGSLDEGLLIIDGRLAKGVTFEQAEEAIDKEITKVLEGDCKAKMLQKAQNHRLTDSVYKKLKLLNSTMELAYYTLLGDTNLINTTGNKIEQVTLEQVHAVAQSILKIENSNVMYYYADNK